MGISLFFLGHKAVEISGLPENLIRLWSNFALTKGTNADAYIDIKTKEMPNTIFKNETGLEKLDEGISYCKDGKILFLLAVNRNLMRADINVTSLDGTAVSLAVHYALMILFSKDIVGIHGVSVIVENQFIILSAPSGTGKTTLARLLHKYCDAAVVNGDYAFLSPDDDGEIYFEPIPFCGSSNSRHNYRLTVDRIVFLSQGTDNKYEELNPRQALAELVKNSFVPDFDESMRADIMENTIKIIERVQMSHFSFAPTEEAVNVLKNNV